jgi:hypothetical protein
MIARFLHVLLPFLPSEEIGHRSVVNSRAIHLNTSAFLLVSETLRERNANANAVSVRLLAVLAKS